MGILEGIFTGIGDLPRVVKATNTLGGLKIRVFFSEPMLVDAALLDTESYILEVEDPPNSVFRNIILVEPEKPEGPKYVELLLDGKLTTGELNYKITVSTTVKDLVENTLDPDFTWVLFNGQGLPPDDDVVIEPDIQKIAPIDPVEISLRSSSQVVIGDLRVNLGFSSIQISESIPEEDENLLAIGSEISIESPERIRPSSLGITSFVEIIDEKPKLVIERISSLETDKCVYEISTKSYVKAPCFGYLKFKIRTGWSLSTPFWCNVSNMTGFYLALESASLRTAGHVFIRNNGVGSLIVGGPLQASNTSRPAQQELSVDLFEGGDESEVEIFLHFNMFGLPPPFTPSYTPMFEIWTRIEGQDAPTIQARIPVGALGTFTEDPSTYFNYRPKITNDVRLMFGMSGVVGDSLEILDWALVPEFRTAVNLGRAVDDHNLVFLPDAPNEFYAKHGHFTVQSPSKWYPSSEFPIVKESSYYQPGNLEEPFYISIFKDVNERRGVSRKEVNLSNDHGFMFEAILSGQELNETDLFGGGLVVDDGTKAYRALMLGSGNSRTIGLLKDFEEEGQLSGYEVSSIWSDYRILKVMRIMKDHFRDKAIVEVDGINLLEIDTADLPNLVSDKRVMLGFPSKVLSKGFLNVRGSRYLTKFNIYTPIMEPDDAPYNFEKHSSGAVEAEVQDNTLLLDKQKVSEVDSKLFYRKEYGFSELGGALVDFECKINSFRKGDGEVFGASTKTGLGVNIYLGYKKIQLGFYDCGIHGKFIGIIPGTGTEEDILNQTALGRRFSTKVDWTKFINYRICLVGNRFIKVWVSSLMTEADIIIPWDKGFDLPREEGATAIEFGHFSELEASESAWKKFRWGSSTGFDLAVSQNFPNGLKSYHFNGRAFVFTEFGES